MRFAVHIQKLTDYPEFKGFRGIDLSGLHILSFPTMEGEQEITKQCNLPATIVYYSCPRDKVSEIQEKGIEYEEPIILQARPHPGQHRDTCLIELNLESIFRDGGRIFVREDGMILVRNTIHIRHILGVIEQA